MMDSSSRSKQAPIYLLMNGPGLLIYSAAGYLTRNWRYEYSSAIENGLESKCIGVLQVLHIGDRMQQSIADNFNLVPTRIKALDGC